jgi:periplasmic divalent cation tolerance protein
MNPIIVMTALPNTEEAKTLANLLLKKKLVACAQVQSEMTSVYEWQGKLETSKEVALHLKTFEQYYKQIEETIKEHHSYDVPEIIAIKIEKISEEYLSWMKSVLS